jgi:copper(I)-binding protein
VQLAPGGLHLMMMNPTEPTEPGDVLKIIIELDDGSTQSLNMTVKK